jgi:NAD(P)-dependent dehydrogenase (short-subunit alcohol dehydrogenase family)
MPPKTRPPGGLEGCAYLVTGGGTGIGAAATEVLVADGATVTICGRTEEKLTATAARLEANVRTIPADVTVEADVERAVAFAQEATGALDGVFANAGGGGALGPIHLQDTEQWVGILRQNLVGTMLTIKHSALPLAASRGSFVGMSSIAGHATHRFFGAYGPAKAAIEHLVQMAADEYGAAGVRYNAVGPGFIATEMMDVVPRDSPIFASYLDNTPMRDIGQPEDVAHLVRFLLGPESRWITGQVINVDGGHSVRGGPDFTWAVEMMFGKQSIPGTDEWSAER